MKKIILISFLGLLLIGVLIAYKNTGATGVVTEHLTPEKTITHGHGLAIDVSEEDHLYIATHHGLLLLQKESSLYRVGGSHDDYMGFTPHPSNPQVFFTSGHPARGGNLGFQRSDDQGHTWEKVSDGVRGPVDFHAMAVSPADPKLFYGWYQGDLERSQDEGKTWGIVSVGTQILQLTADPKDAQVVYASTPSGVSVSRDMGVTWTSLSPELEKGTVLGFAVNPVDTEEMLVSSERLGGLGKSVDGGKTWKSVGKEVKGTVLFLVYSKKDPKRVYGLTHENAIIKSVDGGEVWQRVY